MKHEDAGVLTYFGLDARTTHKSLGKEILVLLWGFLQPEGLVRSGRARCVQKLPHPASKLVNQDGFAQEIVGFSRDSAPVHLFLFIAGHVKDANLILDSLHEFH